MKLPTALLVTAAPLAHAANLRASFFPGFDPSKLLPSCPEPKLEGAICTREYQPVCADGKTFSNLCEAAAAGYRGICLLGKVTAGACQETCPKAPTTAFCTREYQPVCADGKTFSNLCEAEAAGYSGSCTSKITHGACVAYQCPANSFQKTRSAQPRDFSDCECNPGYTNRLGDAILTDRCVKKPYQCPANSFQKTRSAQPRDFFDCECNPGYTNRLGDAILTDRCVKDPSPQCNPNQEHVLVCKNGNKGRHAHDWGACGHSWRHTGSRLYCPRGYYQCNNGFCTKDARGCPKAGIKYTNEVCRKFK